MGEAGKGMETMEPKAQVSIKGGITSESLSSNFDRLWDCLICRKPLPRNPDKKSWNLLDMTKVQHSAYGGWYHKTCSENAEPDTDPECSWPYWSEEKREVSNHMKEIQE